MAKQDCDAEDYAGNEIAEEEDSIEHGSYQLPLLHCDLAAHAVSDVTAGCIATPQLQQDVAEKLRGE